MALILALHKLRAKMTCEILLAVTPSPRPRPGLAFAVRPQLPPPVIAHGRRDLA
jgi:hypothetical protein